MSVYKRAHCPTCKKYVELRNGDDKLKKITCGRCGHVYDNNGVYSISYTLPNGRRKREVVGPDKKFAEIVLSKRKVEIAENKFLDIDKKEDIKFEDFADEYINIHSKQHKKSWETDFHILKNLKGYFRGKYLYEITPRDIEHFKIQRLNEKVGKLSKKAKEDKRKTISPATVNRQLDVLSNLFSKAVMWGKLKTNPMKSVQSLKVPPGRLRFLEKEEINKLLSNCTGNIKAIVTVALFTGMRFGEIIGLKWHDLDFKRNIITLLHTKNGDKREVPMNDIVKNTLIEVRKHPESAYIFCYEGGNPVYDIRKSYSTALKNSGITNFRFHDLRHTFASQLAMSGVDLNTVRELLGHKDMTMTLRYSHLSPSHKQHAVQVLDKLVGTKLAHDKISEVPNKLYFTEVIESDSVT